MTGKLSARRLRAEEEQAEDYAACIRNPYFNGDWKAYNAILIDEYGLAGLQRIKRRAWQIIEEAKR